MITLGREKKGQKTQSYWLTVAVLNQLACALPLVFNVALVSLSRGFYGYRIVTSPFAPSQTLSLSNKLTSDIEKNVFY